VCINIPGKSTKTVHKIKIDERRPLEGSHHSLNFLAISVNLQNMNEKDTSGFYRGGIHKWQIESTENSFCWTQTAGTFRRKATKSIWLKGVSLPSAVFEKHDTTALRILL